MKNYKRKMNEELLSKICGKNNSIILKENEG